MGISLRKLNLLEKKLREIGIIKSVERASCFNDEPKFFQWQCRLENNDYGTSLSLDDKLARYKSIAEAVERYCSFSENHRERLIIERYDELNKEAINPSEFINFDPTLFGKNYKEYADFVNKSKIGWVLGTNSNKTSKILIPAQVVFAKYDFSNEPMIRLPISTGTAFGLDQETTRLRGLLEVIERDNFMIHWLGYKVPRRIRFDKRTISLKEKFERYNLEPHVFNLSLEEGAATAMALLIDRTGIGPAVSVGLKSTIYEGDAVLGALLEAQQVRGWNRMKHSIFKNKKRSIKLKPVNIRDFDSRGDYWYGSDNLSKIKWLLDTHEYANKNRISSYKNFLESFCKNNNTFFVDLTTPSIRNFGFNVIKCIVPSYQPLTYDEAIPYNLGNRLTTIRNNSNKPIILNREPHPFL